VLGRTLTSSDAALIAVDSACDICRLIADQTFNAVTDETILLDGTGTDVLTLPERPVSAISAISVEGTALASTEFKFNSATGDVYRVASATDYEKPNRLVWTWGRRNVSVTYSHGYAAADLPRDVRIAALGIAARILLRLEQGGAVQESLGQYAVRYGNEGITTAATTEDERILSSYRLHKVA
jgi:hypothetical protein